ncbi:hypothetical protein RUM43_009305 [Polyplax serrata]|uniref:Uncharacterized protein n=1 Tax=Polyplax serrata TaxID=468196 RepID=A0AAN8PI86_POLSC
MGRDPKTFSFFCADPISRAGCHPVIVLAFVCMRMLGCDARQVDTHAARTTPKQYREITMDVVRVALVGNKPEEGVVECCRTCAVRRE